MVKYKWQFKRHMMRMYSWINQIKKQSSLDTTINTTSHDIKDILYQKNPAYALDFYTQSFGYIRIKELKVKISPKDIELFFLDFDEAKDVILTVRDIDDPFIEYNSLIKLELEGKEDEEPRTLPARVFWAFLSWDIKAPCAKEHTNEYDRLKHLIVKVAKKNFYVEEGIIKSG